MSKEITKQQQGEEEGGAGAGGVECTKPSAEHTRAGRGRG